MLTFIFAIGTKFNYHVPIWPCEMKGWTGHPFFLQGGAEQEQKSSGQCRARSGQYSTFSRSRTKINLLGQFCSLHSVSLLPCPYSTVLNTSMGCRAGWGSLFFLLDGASIRNIMLHEDFDVEREDTFHFTHRQ